MSNTRRAVLIAVVLAAATLAVYWPIHTHDFIQFDDQVYITGNPHVATGLSWSNFLWSFQAGYGSNWHPLTWLSHMLDVDLFGLDAGRHHLVNVVWHMANTVLLFLWLLRLTGALWRSAMVAALFALHPLHVESVAWAAERKDVLSTFFLFVTLLLYTEYVRQLPADRMPEIKRPARDWYLLALAAFALGLMSKPMLVTLPFIFLLVDFWPLARFEPKRSDLKRFFVLCCEKVPFLVLALGASVLTLVAQSKGYAVKASLPLAARLENASVAYLEYLGKTIWPSDLAIYYPHPALRAFVPGQGAAPVNWHFLLTAVCGLIVLLLISAVAVRQHNRRPWLAMGWFWFLGTLVPVLGLVQVGSQGLADRYTYVPLVGVFIIVVWFAAEQFGQGLFRQRLLAAAAVVLLVACGVRSRAQLGTWQNALTVFSHDLKVAGPNAMAHCAVGMEYAAAGKFDLAMTNLQAALAEDPLYGDTYQSIALVLVRQGKLQEAVSAYQRALQVLPWNNGAKAELAAVLWSLGKHQAAFALASEVLQRAPDNPLAHYQVGLGLSERGELPAAEAQFAVASRLDPNYAEPLAQWAEVLLKQGHLPEAAEKFQQLVLLRPKDAQAHINLGGVLWRLGRFEPAMAEFTAAVRADPQQPIARYNLGFALAAQNRLPEATAEFDQAIRLKADYLEAQAALGRALVSQGRFAEAEKPLREATRLSPTNANYQLNLANALWLAQHTNEAALCFSNAQRLDPSLADKLVEGATAAVAQGQTQGAVARFRVALQLNPNQADALRQLAWILATSPNPALRDGPEAVRLAQRACALTNAPDTGLLAALDAAYAEAGRFPDAIRAAEQSREAALKAGDQAGANAADTRLALYRQQQPFRQ